MRQLSIGIWLCILTQIGQVRGDKETPQSVSGSVLFPLNVPLMWKSQSHKEGVSLSSSEAEYCAMAQAVKDVRFVVHLLQAIGIKVEMPITIEVDNIVAIFVVENMNTNSHTKHIDMCFHFVCKYIEEGDIKTVFVKTEDNKADSCARNAHGDVYENQ
jgi:hypothetical protein